MKGTSFIMKTGITIFTPTYNRATTLPRLYHSLLKQTNHDFEWLIVDDGSIDHSKDLIQGWMDENKISIRYIYQENHGKTYAHNVGVKNAKYNLFFCVDSDDYIGENTIQELNAINSLIMNDDEIVGIMGYKKNILCDKIITKKIPVKTITVAALYRKYHFKDELALLYKTDILKQHLFPIIKGEKFVPESYLYDQLDTIGKCYFLQDYIYYYEYQEDGYTNHSAQLLKNNVQGYILYSKQRLEISKLWRNRVKGAIQYNIANLIAKNHFRYMKNKHFMLLIVTFIPSYFYYLKKYRNLK